MSYNCPHCKDRGSISHEYPDGHSRFGPSVTVYEICHCQANKTICGDIESAQRACDIIVSDQDYAYLAEFIDYLEETTREIMLKRYAKYL